jgi:hypothetical protein
MTKNLIQPLESYRLAQYAWPVPCYICESENTFDAEFCTRCSAPMALAHQIGTQETAPHMVSVIGPSGVGKTVYLGMLIDMLSRVSKDMQFLARGAFSITLQQTTIASLSRCQFPEKTSNEPDRWNWVHCQIRRPKQKKPVELVIPDLAGEALLEEIDHPGSYRVIRSVLQKSTAAMILIDADKLQEGRRDHDFFTMKLVSYLTELDQLPKRRRSNRPVAFIMTKADRVDSCLEDPQQFAMTHATGLWQQCQERFRHFRFFASSVTGACGWCESSTEGRCQVPLRIEPHGIIEPFLWLLENLKIKPPKPR